MQRIATCSCGELKIRCEGEPLLVSACHCSECQRRTGSAYGIAAFFDRDQTEPAGASLIYERASDSGFAVIQHFCGKCGSTVYWYPTRRPERVAVAVGCFDDPHFPAPSKAVFTEHAHAWAMLGLG